MLKRINSCILLSLANLKISSYLWMNDGSITPYVDTCNYLGNTISIKCDKYILDNAVNDLYMWTNCLLSDF